MRCKKCPRCVGRGRQIIGKHTFWPTHGQCQSLQEFSGASYCKTILSWTGTFFSSCQLETCEILSISVFVLLGNGQVLQRNQEQELAGILYSFWVQPSHLNPGTAWHERRCALCSREKEDVSGKDQAQGTQFILTPDLCFVCESPSWYCCIRSTVEEQLIGLVRF